MKCNQCLSNFITWNCCNFIILLLISAIIKFNNYELFTIENLVIINIVLFIFQMYCIYNIISKKLKWYIFKSFLCMLLFSISSIFFDWFWYKNVVNDYSTSVAIAYLGSDMFIWTYLCIKELITCLKNKELDSPEIEEDIDEDDLEDDFIEDEL